MSVNVSRTADSISADSSADCHTARTSRAAPSRSPSFISPRASASRPTELAGSLPTKRRTVVPSCRSCHSLASARRRSNAPGQSGLAPRKAAYRSNPAGLSELRSSAHSISLCATGSLIDAASAAASFNLLLRISSIACFATPRSVGSDAPAGRSIGSGTRATASSDSSLCNAAVCRFASSAVPRLWPAAAAALLRCVRMSLWREAESVSPVPSAAKPNANSQTKVSARVRVSGS